MNNSKENQPNLENNRSESLEVEIFRIENDLDEHGDRHRFGRAAEIELQNIYLSDFIG